MLLLEFRRDAVGDDRPDRMDDIFAGQVVGLGDLGLASRFLMALLLHHLIAFLAQLYARCGMDGIVNALVQGMETAQHLAIGCVYNGVYLQTGNIPLPN